MSRWPLSKSSKTFSIRSELSNEKKNDLPRNIEVYAYSGYKANERPTAFIMDNRTLNVSRIIDRWYGAEHDYYKILAEDGGIYLIRWHRILDLWFLVKVMEREGKH
jgi:hypothetical protein